MNLIERATTKRAKAETVMRAHHWRERLSFHQAERARNDQNAKDCLAHLQEALIKAYELGMGTAEIWGEPKR